MIKKINIANFGCFNDFEWGVSLRDAGNNVVELKKINIIYGWNYSGKTTLSKIFRSLEEKRLPNNYNHPEFTITTDEVDIKQNEVDKNSLSVRVYNSDFIRENLSFLYDSDNGLLKPFALIGSTNNQNETKINEIEQELGSLESESGLRFREHSRLEAQASIIDNYNSSKRSLDNKLIGCAKQIKLNKKLEDVNYNIAKIRNDIQKILNNGSENFILGNEPSIEALLKEEPLTDINVTLPDIQNMGVLFSKVNNVLNRKLEPTQPIQKLLNDSILQTWVRQGMNIHSPNSEECEFCGNNIPADLWARLSGHFNNATLEMESEIETIISQIIREKNKLSNLPIDPSLFYSEYKEKYQQIVNEYNKYVLEYKKYLDELIEALNKKKSEVYNVITVPKYNQSYEKLNKASENFSSIINENNSRTRTLHSDQVKARNNLRLSIVAKFLKQINYDEEIKNIDRIEKLKAKAIEETRKVRDQIESHENVLKRFKSELKSETIAAQSINDYLNHYFGHNKLELKLSADESNDEINYKFEIYRGDEPAHNLSEGESSLISFCYFITKLKELEEDYQNAIIYIDDPISSLDNNHIYFIYSLIESEIAKPENYKQLIISTHNIEFLKYTKRLTKPDNNSAYFIIENNGDKSLIKTMPKHLKKYATEFNYLFNQIYDCKDAENREAKSSSFYSFGNSMRKFLEAYLYFKYPSGIPMNDKIKLFFGGDCVSTTLTQRVTNEYSHLENMFDRGMEPIDIIQITKLANFILDKMFENDKEQYNALLLSIGEPLRE